LAQNIVAVWDPSTGEPRYQEIFGHVFGKSAAVINFHRLQRLLTSVLRRWLALLVSFYYDDATLQDLNSSRGRDQRLLRAFFHLVGRPLSQQKQIDLQGSADYLGLRHDVTRALSDGLVSFSPREKLWEKVSAMMATFRSADWMSPAEASKLRGVLQFMSAGTYGRVGCGGMHALLRRQYSDTAPFRLTPSLRAACQYFEQVLSLPLRRECRLWQSKQLPLVIASDGRLDSSAPASVATLVVDPESGSRRAWLAEIPPALVRRWSSADQYIAQVEQAAIAMLLIGHPRVLAGRDAFWYIDNTVALSAVVKGSSADPDLARAAAAIHLAMAMAGTRVWFEYIESESN
jgi:hypothetical protein